nr:uncharacterized protein LOC109169412 [Ipomoea trifida]
MVRNHFVKLFSEEQRPSNSDHPFNSFPRVSPEIWTEIYKENALMKRLKMRFSIWRHTEPRDLTVFMHGSSRNSEIRGVLSEGLNDTLVALIPKVMHPEKPSKFRPISFCNVAYKVITKVLTNKIKEEIITKSINKDGLDIKCVREMNKAFMAKMDWRINNEKDSL